MELSHTGRTASVISHNVRRLMAKECLSHSELAAATGLDERTLRGVLRGENKTRSSTLHKIAEGLGITVDSLFQPPMGMSAADFDTATNPAVEKAIAANPELFTDWGPQDLTELASQFGIGGELTEEGVIEVAQKMTARRKLLYKAKVILESRQSHLLEGLIEVLYEQVTVNK